MTEDQLIRAFKKLEDKYTKEQLQAFRDDKRVLAAIFQHFIDYSHNLRIAIKEVIAEDGKNKISTL